MAAPRRRPLALSRPPLERTEQAQLCSWLRARGYEHHAIPNAGIRTYRAARSAQEQGLTVGVADLMITSGPRSTPLPPQTRGIFVELKRARSPGHSTAGPTRAQRAWLDRHAQLGYSCHVCYGAQDAIAAIERATCVLWATAGATRAHSGDDRGAAYVVLEPSSV